MTIEWTPKAKERLTEIAMYYEKERGKKSAIKVIAQIKKAVNSLKQSPHIAALEPALADLCLNIRSLVIIPRYKVIYVVDYKTKQISIITIWDCRQNPRKLKNEVINH